MQPKRSKGLLIVVAACMLLSIAAGAWMLDEPRRTRAQQQQALQAARERWQAQSISNYRLRLEKVQLGGASSCLVDVRVINAQITSVEEKNCIDPWQTMWQTVESLFEEAEGFLQVKNVFLYMDKLPPMCREQIRVNMHFHSDLGYPLMFEVRSNSYPNWLHIDTYRSVLSNGHPPQCGFPRDIGTRYVIRELTPLSGERE